MKLIVVHGVPGVGKRTVCNELSRITRFPFFNTHHLAVAIGPVFGFTSPTFNALRDAWWDQVIQRSAGLNLPGLIASMIFEPTVPPERMTRCDEIARSSGGELLLAALTCPPEELRLRVTASDRAPLGKWTDFDALAATMASGFFDVPPALPGRSVAIDTTGMPARVTANRIAEFAELSPPP